MSSRFILAMVVAVVACSSDKFEYADTSDAGDASAGSGGTGLAGDGGGVGGSGGTSAGAGGSSAGASGSGGIAGTGGSATVCPSGSDCTSVPAGWEGPLYLYRAASGATPPSCANAAAAVVDGFIGLDVAAGSCGCACSGTSTCANSLNVSLSQTSCSTGACSTKTLAKGSCIQLDSGCSAYATVSDAPAGGPCTAVSNPSLPTPTWSEVVKACKAVQNGKCATGTCVEPPPTPFSNSVCIGKAGDVACDGPGYSKKVLVHQSYQDTRSCGSCYCTPNKCGQVTIYPNGCSSSVSKKVLPGTCGAGYAVGGGVLSVWARYSAIGGSCIPNKPSLTGDVKEAAAYTLCCEQ